MKKVLFFKNALILTVTSLLLRTVGIFFRVWLTGQIGAEGIGLYQVVYSVYVLASTFATSGICTAVTRMVTSYLSENDKKGAVKSVKTAILLSLIIAFASMAVILCFADQIAKYIIKDVRAALSLKILCFSLPFMGVCSCIRGYFLARRSTLPPSFCQMAEQIVRIGVIFILIGKVAPYGIAAASAAVMAGDAASEMIGAFLLYLSYVSDKKHIRSEKNENKQVLPELLRIATPISLGRYIHTCLRTAENLLTPICFSKYKGTELGGLEQFGMIKGMALPLLLFPASILSSISTLMVTEITESASKGNKAGIAKTGESVLCITSIFSFLIGAIFFAASTHIGEIVYNSREVGYLIRALSPLVPFMYLDLICDGILKGLDEQKTLFKTSVTDSAVRVLLVLVLVPEFGMKGFLLVMMFSNVYTSIASLIKIVKITNLKFKIAKMFLSPLFSAATAVIITGKLLKPISSNIIYVAATVAGISAIYFVLIFLQLPDKTLTLKKPLFFK